MAFYRQSAYILRNLITQTGSCRTETRNIKRWVAPTLRILKKRKDKLGPQPELPRSGYLDWNYQAEIYAFGKRLNEEFDKNLLEKALTNRSYVIQEEKRQSDVGIENPNINLEDNKSLIREGEKFINNCVYQKLKTELPKFPEQGIKAVCIYLLTNENLANVGMHIGLKDITLCSEYPPDHQTISNTFKAIVAALLKSSGEERATDFVEEFVVLRQMIGKDVNDIWKIEQPLKLLHDLLKAETEPRLCNQSAANTILAAYQVGLYIDKKCVGLGWGETIEIAIEMAAREGLKRIFNTTDSMPSLRSKQIDLSMSPIKRTVVHN